MFLEYFKLREQPFGVTPDPRYLFPSAGHREALASLLYSIETNLGFGALIAQPGMGKTTLLFHILEQYRKSARTAFIFNTQCNSYDLLRSLLSELDEDSSGRDTFQLHEKFKQVLAKEGEAHRRVILVIDEAQNLGDMVMETVRLLSNFESAHVKLLHIILAGQPELAAKLGRPELSQLQQRIPMLTHLPCLSPQDIASYIEHRLRVAGYQGTPLFTPEAVRHIVWLSRGVPREINRLCFNSLSLAYASSKPVVDLQVIDEVVADLGFNAPPQEGVRVHDKEARRGEQVDQYQPVAVNSAAARARPPQPRPAQVWPTTAAHGPRRVESARKQSASTASIPMSSVARQARNAGPVAIEQRPRRLPPRPQRIRRVAYSSNGWQTYKRSIGYALCCFTLIAAGWAAVTHWVHPGSSYGGDQQSVVETTAPPSAEQTANTTSPFAEARRPDSTPKPVSQTNRIPQPAKANQEGAPIGNSGYNKRSVRPQTPVPRSGAQMASARTPASASRPQNSNPASPRNVQVPPVKEPTVAAQGQMEFVKYVRPHYPEEARNRHIEGTVILSAVVARDGTVRGVKPVSGDPSLLKAAETAVRDWVYRPYQINGKPVDVDTEIVINFALPRRLNP